MKQNSRKRFFKWLIKKAKKDKRVLLLTADLGYNYIEEYQRLFPDRFINVGIAEQNMIGIATGLTLMGWKPYCYTNAVFLNYKCIEQIRNAAMQGIRLNVVGSSVTGFLGSTHNFVKGEREPLKYIKNVNYIRL
jgi:transketolase